MTWNPNKDDWAGRVTVSPAATMDTNDEPTLVDENEFNTTPQPYAPNKADWLPQPKREAGLARVHRWLKILEPWGIALALIAFAIDLNGRGIERTRGAWELLSLDGPGNSGKIEALEYLNRGIYKYRHSLTGIDLSADGKKGTYLKEVRLKRADLAGANLRGADLEGADLRYAKLVEADLTGANLRKADLWKAKLRGAVFKIENLDGAKLSGAHFQEVNFQKSDLSGWVFFRANLSRADLSRTSVVKTNFSWANLENTNLSKADMWKANLREADLWKANLSNVELWEADLKFAELREADLVDAELWWADLWGAVLTGADLSGAELYRADLTGASLWNVRNLTQEQLNESCGNKMSVLPVGFTIPMCSDVYWYKRVHGDKDPAPKPYR